jgi:hypothetical protein
VVASFNVIVTTWESGEGDFALPRSLCGKRVSLGCLGHREHLPQRNAKASILEERGRGHETMTSVRLAAESAERQADSDLRTGEVRDRQD